MSNKNLNDAITLYGSTRESLMSVMQYVVSKEKWLSENMMDDIAVSFGISPAEVYGVASFYTFLDVVPRGKYVIRLCRTISCDMEGKGAIMAAISGLLRVKPGETTPDSMFSFLETNCMGWCHEGPAMLVNDDVHTKLTPEKAVKIIQSYIDSEKQ